MGIGKAHPLAGKRIQLRCRNPRAIATKRTAQIVADEIQDIHFPDVGFRPNFHQCNYPATIGRARR